MEICEKSDFYKVKTSIEKKITNLLYSGVEWRAHNNIDLTNEQKQKVIIMLENLEDIDDIQRVFINCKF